MQIGLFGEDDSKLVMIGSVHEWGLNIAVTPKMRAFLNWQGLHLKKSKTHINIPERSFIRGTFDNKLKEIEKQGETLLENVILGDLEVKEYYQLFGAILVGFIQEYMTDLREPANSQFTIDRKGSSNPLIDSGRLRQSITWKVV